MNNPDKTGAELIADGRALRFYPAMTPTELSPEQRALSHLAAVTLVASDLVREVKSLAKGAVNHPHGNVPRVVVFADQMEACVQRAEKVAVFMPPRWTDTSDGYADELASVLRAKERAADLEQQCAKLRIATEQACALLQKGSAEDAKKILEEETNALPPGDTPLSPQVLTDCYFPVNLWPPAPGDVTVDLQTKVALRCKAGDEHTATKPDGLVVLRPFGAHGAMTLRLGAAVSRLQALMQVEENMARMNRHTSKNELHTGRCQGMHMALEFLVGPSWELPPAVLAKEEAKPEAPATL